ncbi:30S ribosomal protein S7 [Candidatus Gracilibacteria bacterium]|nr:MAG: 30S ribosomal protein S7 [Candidatus Gracilibacteria bacterium]PIE85059.1 MAG: 30S ribosomal protein S7 [Candidatus Gracilibacteria bacterium]
MSKQELGRFDTIVEKFINYVMLDGKKSIAISIMNDTFSEIKSKGQKDPNGVFIKALENVMPKIEVRPKRVGGSIFQVPQEVAEKRQMFLASKWIIDSARSKKGAKFSKFLADELIDAANETGNAYKKKLDVYKMAEANKAFARFANKKRK